MLKKETAGPVGLSGFGNKRVGPAIYRSHTENSNPIAANDETFVTIGLAASLAVSKIARQYNISRPLALCVSELSGLGGVR